MSRGVSRRPGASLVKIAVTISRILLGIIFVVFGANLVVSFIPTPPLTGFVADFTNVIMQSHYAMFLGAVQVFAGVLLLVNRYVPLAIVILAPVLANILVFHLTMQPIGLPPGILATILWFVVAWPIRSRFAPLFTAQ